MRKFIPTYTDHLARYLFALGKCYKKNVVDLGCKDGYGSVLLGYGADKLDLVDVSDYFLRSAKTEHKYFCPVEFHQVDFEKSFPVGSWDVAVAFEIIEHLENVDFFIQNIANHLKPGGTLVFSVPEMVANREHKTLFDEQKIKDLISKYLTLTEFYIDDKKIFSGEPKYHNLKCFLGVARKIVYDKEYLEYIDAGSRNQKRINNHIARIMKYNPKRVLDVGCGKGYLVKALLDRGIDAWGVDISDYAGELIPNNFIKTKTLPKGFDVVFSAETLEHIPELEVPQMIEQMKNAGTNVIANICTKPEKHKYDTHLTIKPLDWWKQFNIEVF